MGTAPETQKMSRKVLSLALRSHKSFNRGICTTGQRCIRSSGSLVHGSVPDNVAELGESDKSSFLQNNRSREVSGMQTSQMFAGSFMSHQGATDSTDSNSDIDVGSSSCQINDTRGYDMGGSANLDAVLMTNVP